MHFYYGSENAKEILDEKPEKCPKYKELKKHQKSKIMNKEERNG